MLLIGPPGSGKTASILRSLEDAVRSHRSDEVQLLVPTASMKHHLRSRLARAGLMVPDRLVVTMPEFVRAVTPELREAAPVVQDRLLRAILRDAPRQEFGALADSAGLRDRLAALMGEFWAAGADNLQLESAVRTRGQRAFQALFQRFEEGLASAGFVHHNQRIALAASAIRREGLGPVKSVFVDGFDRFTKQQEELLNALAEQTEEIRVAMPTGLASYPQQARKPEYLPEPSAPGPAVEVAQAPSPRAEVLEVARRVLAGGRPFHEHGIVLRSPEHYLPLLRDVFETLRIPFRIWEPSGLADQGVARHFMLWLRVIERQFPAEEALEALMSPLSPVGNTPDADAFDFEIRATLPGTGLAFLRSAARRSRALAAFLKRLEPLESWPRQRLGAAGWADECLALLPALQKLPVPLGEDASFQRARDWKAALQAAKAIRRAVAETAELPEFAGGKPIALGTFVDALEDVVRFSQAGGPDQRYEVVHILPVLESRQWSLPVVFVCGLAEGWFPRRFGQDALFDDEDRAQLRSRGIELRTSANRAEEERFLFETARTRAAELAVLSYPLTDHLGKPLMKSSLIDDTHATSKAPRALLGDLEPGGAAPCAEALPAEARPAVAAFNPGFSASGVASYRQCPYLYFAAHTLKLRGRPPAPDRRLDSAQLGTIVHEALHRWNKERTSMAELVEEAFQAALGKLNIPVGFRVAQLRRSVRDDLERFAAEWSEARPAFGNARSFFETERLYRLESLDAKPTVRCRIDRYEVDEEGRCFVTDYKYARPASVKALLKDHLAGEQLQLALYLAALEQELACDPGGLLLCGLRGETTFAGAATVETDGLQEIAPGDLRALLDAAGAAAADAAGAILRGTIAAEPRDRDFCGRSCDYADVCRIRWSAREDRDAG